MAIGMGSHATIVAMIVFMVIAQSIAITVIQV